MLWLAVNSALRYALKMIERMSTPPPEKSLASRVSFARRIPPAILQAETAYWRRQAREAQGKKGYLQTKLSELILDDIMLGLEVNRGLHNLGIRQVTRAELEADGLQQKYQYTQAALALSLLIRASSNISTVLDEGQASFDTPNHAVDCGSLPEDPAIVIAQVHLAQAEIHDLFPEYEATPEGWYEEAGFYLHTFDRANPSLEFQGAFEEWHGPNIPFIGENYVTLRPELKLDYLKHSPKLV